LPKHACGALFALGISVVFSQSSTVPDYDVASVKPDTVGTNEGPGRGEEKIELTPSGLTMRNIRLRTAMKWAYRVQTDQVSGPAWMDSERYLIIGKAGSPVPEEQIRLMLQKLLAYRFQLKLHRETREMTAFVLTVDKGGPKFKPSSESGEGGTRYAIKYKVIADRATLPQFADSLMNPLKGVVLDETGLKGRYSFTLDLDGYEEAYKPGQIPLEDFPALTARGLREELGLKVESHKREIPVIVVDHAEKTPIEN
jgi:uncharacterized protein (TIGR03435 family)